LNKKLDHSNLSLNKKLDHSNLSLNKKLDDSNLIMQQQSSDITSLFKSVERMQHLEKDLYSNQQALQQNHLSHVQHITSQGEQLKAFKTNEILNRAKVMRAEKSINKLTTSIDEISTLMASLHANTDTHSMESNSAHISPTPAGNNKEEEQAYVVQHAHSLSRKTVPTVIDSGATASIFNAAPPNTSNRKITHNSFLTFGGDNKFTLKASETFSTSIAKTNLLVKDAKINLISVPQADNKGIATLFYNGTSIMWDPSNGHVHATGTLKDMLYHLDNHRRFSTVPVNLLSALTRL
jgi:hypothetical protein